MKGHGEGRCDCQWRPCSFTLPFSFLAISQAEKDKILKLSAEILRLEKAVQEERTQNQVLRTELTREKDSSLVRHPATQVLVLWRPEASGPPSVLGVGSEVPCAHLYIGQRLTCTHPSPHWFETCNGPFCSEGPHSGPSSDDLEEL